MTGYVPNPAAPPPRSDAQVALPVLDLVAAGLALVAFILAFLPWFGLNCSGVAAEERSDCESVHYSGWELPAGTAGSVLLIVAALLLLRRLFDSTAPAGSSVPALLGLLGAVLVVVQFVVGYAFLDLFGLANVAKTGRKAAAILALVVALVEAAVLVLAWLQASGRVTRRPASAAPVGPGPDQPWQPPQRPPAPAPGQGWTQPPPQPSAQPGYGQPRDYPPPSGYGQPPQGPPPSAYPSGPSGPSDPYPPRSGEHGTPRYP